MEEKDLDSMSADELWMLYGRVAAKLAAKLIAQKSVLENRLEQLSRRFQAEPQTGQRPHPKAIPKFRNPDEPSQTWTGRGKQPRWLRAQLRSGRRIEDFQAS
jgi:DNA-binding protein H-NS